MTRQKKLGPEQQIKNSILDWLRLHNIFAWPNDSTGVYDVRKGVFRRKQSRHHVNGVSDILGVHLGRPVAIEVKSKTGRVSEVQKQFLENFKQAGGIAIVARSIDEVAEALNVG